jgi:anthranilate phosphoribosyltransferase
MTVLDPVAQAIRALAERRDLSADESHRAFAQVMAGEATPIRMAAMLMGLRAKGETADEIEGAARALRGAMVRVSAPPGGPLVDTCGTGGGSLGTFNISTAAALVAAGAGARVAKHGNRSFTSRSGSADVLEALGVRFPADASEATRLLETCGMTFLFAPNFHPAMRHVAPVRRELGLTTIMNLLGPLANPAAAPRQVVGVPDRGRAPLIAGALKRLGSEHALVVHARAGMDEISPVGATDVWEVHHGSVREWTFEPDAWRLPTGSLEELAGGEPDQNARLVEAVVQGRDRTVRRAAVVLNAAAALLVTGVASSWNEAIESAQASIDERRASRVLAKLRTSPAA